MSRFPYHIHEFLTRRRRIVEDEVTSEEGTIPPVYAARDIGKTYPRMKRVALDAPLTIECSLQDSIARRTSAAAPVAEPLPRAHLSTLLHTLSLLEDGRRRYPSGGARYPIESYVLANRVADIPRGAYHYRPDVHELELLWDLPAQLELFVRANHWAEEARAVLLFTGVWSKSMQKYGDFGYLLGVLEAGHMAQNILLAAAGLGVPACPAAGLRDDRASDLLDLDQFAEQPVYAVVFG